MEEVRVANNSFEAKRDSTEAKKINLSVKV